jgi:histidyl-tRNA synthetase
VEVIALAWDLLASLGVGGLALELNSLGSADDRKAYRTALVAWLEQRTDQLDEDSRSRLSTNPLRILDSKNKATQALLESAPTLIDALSSESRTRFDWCSRG